MKEAYLTPDLPGTGGVLRFHHEDFEVEEQPLYEPSGQGDHVFFRVRKRGLATFEVVRRLARDLKIPERRIGYAGLKDARAVTCQWMSAEETDEAAVKALRYRHIRIDSVTRHGNKLKVGHLRGNRFRLRIREAGPAALDRAANILDVLVRRGAPNYFGEQRFGIRADGHLIGEAIVRKDPEEFVRRLLGGPSDLEKDERLRVSRTHFDAGRLQEAYNAMPLTRRTEKKALHSLLDFRDDYERAFFAVPKRMRQMFASAFQSRLFNDVLEARICHLDRLQEGDLAYLHHNGAVFQVEDLAREQLRCDAFEISPSGPIFGTRSPLPDGKPGELERKTLADHDLTQESFEVGGGLRLRGLRRSLRIPLRNVALVQEAEGLIRVDFSLPSGSFATSVMREVMKTD